MVTLKERLAAGSALILGLVALLLLVDFAIESFPRGLIVTVGLVIAGGVAWHGTVRSGAARLVSYIFALLLVVLSVIFFFATGGGDLRLILVLAACVAGIYAAGRAFTIRVPLPAAASPSRPVLFVNPASGDRKAERFALVDEAEKRGIRTVELSSGRDLEELVRTAVREGADGLAMAGGDGCQAIVAAVAAENDLPYACIPAGTRNHFALDLGVDRDDVVGALDSFVDGGERRVDLAEVNGRVFVNNVSLGIYAEAVQKDEYREAKLRTILDTVPEVLGPRSDAPALGWKSPSGKPHRSAAAILVSNNRYRLGRPIGSGTRPKIDDGCLGVAVLADPGAGRQRFGALRKPWRDWSTGGFEVESDGPVAAGIDGEAARLDPPLRFRIRPGVLRVRIARAHPGASPSAAVPDGLPAVVLALFRITIGRKP